MTTEHMLTGRDQKQVHVKCGIVLKLSAGQHLPDIHVTSRPARVTCPACAAITPGAPK